MSIASMTNVAYARRTDNDLPVPKGVAAVNAAAHGSHGADDAVTSALGALVAYFPTEINVLYTAVVAAITTAGGAAPTTQWVAFVVVLVLTPVAVWFVYATRVRNGGAPLPTSLQTWPVAEMATATVAFAIWAGALPASPLQRIPGYTPALAAVVVLSGTAVLGWIAALLQRPIDAGPPVVASPPGRPSAPGPTTPPVGGTPTGPATTGPAPTGPPSTTPTPSGPATTTRRVPPSP
jgi:hypothetical protein